LEIPKPVVEIFLGLKVFDGLANKIIGIESEKTRREIKNASAEK